jgi:O-antigen/teichoic acid export membrane protein
MSKNIIFGLAGSSFIANFISFAATPFIARIYGPKTLGIFFGLIALASISSVIVSRKLEVNLPLLKSNKKAAEALISNLLSSTFYILILNMFLYLITFIGFIDGQNILNRFRIEFTLITLVFILYSNITQFSLRIKSYSQVRDRNLLQPILVTLFQIIFGLKFPTIISLTSAELIGRIISFTRTIFNLIKFLPGINIVNIIKRKQFFKITKAYPYYVTESFFSVFFLLFVMYKYGSSIGGQFALSWKIATAPAALFGISIGQFFIIKTGRSKNKYQKIRVMIGKISWIINSLTILFIFGFLVIGIFLLDLVLGPAWQLSGDFLVALILMSATNMLWTIYSNLAVLIGRQDILKFSAIIKMSSLTIIAVTILFTDISSVITILWLANISAISDLISIKLVKNALYVKDKLND